MKNKFIKYLVRFLFVVLTIPTCILWLILWFLSFTLEILSLPFIFIFNGKISLDDENICDIYTNSSLIFLENIVDFCKQKGYIED